MKDKHTYNMESPEVHAQFFVFRLIAIAKLPRPCKSLPNMRRRVGVSEARMAQDTEFS